MMEWLQSLWEGLAGFFIAIDWSFWAVWSLTLTLLLVGLLGAVIPFLPGPLLIFLGGVVHTVLRPESAMSWPGIAVLALLLGIAYVIDFASGMLGARWFGASRWGIIGVFVGGVVGLFFSLPGLILGPLIGGFAFEMLFAQKEIKPAARSTWGTLLGTGVGLLARVAISVLMIAVFFADALWW
jgi:uncharacterized protein YqgC (DUF456 family)